MSQVLVFFQNILVPIFFLNLILVVYLLIAKRPIKITFLRKEFYIILVLFLLTLAIRFSLPHSHQLWTDEFLYVESAKEIISSFAQSELYQRPVGWPSVLAIFFLIFGMSNIYALFFASLIGAINVVLVYLLTRKVTGKKNIGYASATIFAFLPTQLKWSNSIETNIFSIFTILFTLIIMFDFCQKANLNKFYLLLAAIGISMQTRFENIMLIPILLLGLLIYKKNYQFLRKNHSKLLIVSLFFIVLIIPNLFVSSDAYQTTPEFDHIQDPSIAGDLLGYGNFLWEKVSEHYSILSIVLIFFFFLGLYRLYTRDQKIAIIVFAFLFLVYIFNSLTYQVNLQGALDRFFMKLLIPIVLFIGIGIFHFSFIILKKLSKVQKSLVFYTILTFIMIALIVEYPNQRVTYPMWQLQTEVPELAESVISDKCSIITSHKEFFSSTNFDTIKLAELVNNRLYDSLDFENSCILFFDDITCQFWDAQNSMEQCKNVKDYFQMEIYQSFSLEHRKYSFFKIVGVI